MNARKRLRARAKNLPQCVREFLTPQVFKQVRSQVAGQRKKPRWDVHPLIWVMLLMAWSAGDSLPEKFEVARGVYVACCPKRRRPGKSFSGFEKALGKLPMPVLRALGTSLRTRIQQMFGDRLIYEGFIPLGCDGTRHECPRSEELEQRLGTVTRDGNLPDAPSIWNTSIVHLALGIPWCWRFGRGSKASERKHLKQMIPLLPKLALIVTDAGYVGYELTRALMDANVWFLIRMSCNATLFTTDGQEIDSWREGIVYYWPVRNRRKKDPPIRGRLIRVVSRKRKHDVWLLTNIEDPNRLSVALASRLYRWRWESEGFFRTYKRTLKKLKFESRAIRLVHREAELSMLATQLLLCQGALAMPAPKSPAKPIQCSPRGVLLVIRAEFASDTFRSNYSTRLSRARRDNRHRISAKQKRESFPGRRTHKPPEPPIILPLPDDLKSKVDNYFQAA
jgi:hypothetical protein